MSARVSTARLTRAVDCLFVALLTVLVLLNLDQSFSSRSYLLVGLIAVVTAVTLAALVHTAGKGSEVFLLWAIPTYVAIGALTVHLASNRVRFQVAEALLETVTVSITAPGDFLTTIPPVDADASVLILPFAIGYLTAGGAAWLALHTGSLFGPMLPVLLGQMATIALGPPEPGGLVWRSLPFAVLGFVWVLLRDRRTPDVSWSGRGWGARFVVACCLLGIAAATYPLLGVENPLRSGERVILRGRIGQGANVDNAESPLAGFRRYTRQQPGTPGNLFAKRLLRIEGLPEGVWLRFVTLDRYDGTHWRPGNRTVAGTGTDLFQRIGTEVSPPLPGRRLEARVEILRGYQSSWLPVAGQLTGVTFDFLDGTAQREDVRYNLATSSALVIGGVGPGDDYRFTAVEPDRGLTRSESGYPTNGPLQEAGAFLDPLLEPWSRSTASPLAKLQSFARYLKRNGRYSDGASGWERRYTPGHDAERLGQGFLGAPRMVGNDEQYAALLALAANRLGVPARVVVGALPTDGGMVRGKHVRAWVEIRVADGSWRRLSPRSYMSMRRTVRRQPPKADPSAGSPVRQPAAPADGPGEGSAVGPASGSSGSGGAPTADPTTRRALTLVLLLMPGLVPLSKRVRRERRRRWGRASNRFVGGWKEVLDLAKDQGRGVPDGLTRVEQARRLGRGNHVAETADSGVFGLEEPLPEMAEEFWQTVLTELRLMNREVGPFRRLVAFMSPSSLSPLAKQGRRRSTTSAAKW